MIIRSVKKSTSVLLLVILLLPAVLKIEHHHSYEFKSGNENPHSAFHSKCAVCSFEFSVFSACTGWFELSETTELTAYFQPEYSFQYFSHADYSFLLRAPPSGQI
jgi:hypothetical protein